MGEICHKMFTADMVSLDSEIVFSINVFKEEPAMSASVYLYRNIMLGFFLFFLVILAINFSPWNLRRLNFSSLFTTYICIILCYILLLTLTLEVQKRSIG